MVEKIIINPNKVRGYGNIVSSKGASDFITYAGSITEGTDTVYGATEKVYTLEDTFLFTDAGTTNNHNDNWSTWGSYTVTRTRKDTYTLIEPVDRTTASYQIKYLNNLTNPRIIEFDCKQVGGQRNSIIFQLRGNNQSVVKQVSLSNFGSEPQTDVWYHWKVDLENKTFTNVTLNQSVTFDTGTISFFFTILANAAHNFHYKNFVVYG